MLKKTQVRARGGKDEISDVIDPLVKEIMDIIRKKHWGSDRVGLIHLKYITGGNGF